MQQKKNEGVTKMKIENKGVIGIDWLLLMEKKLLSKIYQKKNLSKILTFYE